MTSFAQNKLSTSMQQKMARNSRFLRGEFRKLRLEVAKQPIAQKPIQERYKTVFISDLHLGSNSARPAKLLRFLSRIEAEHIVLVGDIVDLWCPLERNWNQIKRAVLRRLIEMHKLGARITYIPGNHDPIYRGINQKFGQRFEIRDDWDFHHQGKIYWVTHGDIADRICHNSPLIAYGSTHFVHIVRNAGTVTNMAAQLLNRSPVEFHERLIYNFSVLQEAHSRHVQTLSDMARARCVDGVICGHFHLPKRETHNGVDYINCGDWIENCSALVETHAGNLQLRSYAQKAFVTKHLNRSGVELTPQGA